MGMPPSRINPIVTTLFEMGSSYFLGLIEMIFTSVAGFPWAATGTCPILSTTSMPPETRPKTVCFPASQGVSTRLIKNWEPLVFGPALAIARDPLNGCCPDPSEL